MLDAPLSRESQVEMMRSSAERHRAFLERVRGVKFAGVRGAEAIADAKHKMLRAACEERGDA